MLLINYYDYIYNYFNIINGDGAKEEVGISSICYCIFYNLLVYSSLIFYTDLTNVLRY